ncbi:PTS fructose transporter subunit IIA [Bacillus halotolerans]|uniref:PTS fructose transporter subunit IIA n=1 Tax=Bacillus halotolerans TaxID=260554 RepID=A0A9Q6A6U1_9BACI|nr:MULTISPECIES: PTS fructose transporter subunit IIA [Bacillus]AZV50776.1 PTS fructose transporter subunit IIA [Bacillus halotolerans]MCP9298969.1 PTS fructose transporter subunit IIA [Bacillus halotolerans]MCV0022856.1 PTS fructose transporter subunit IIA [Bacillus sp. XT-2]MCY8097902.1 PTS fructose transporter subunit IIA [Bacillus atrophaeus]MCY8473175.1 PTS fructose transporter subunit IIA [Bacillus halotolerans]
MISVIISGHGDFPIALKESSGMIFGEENHLIAVPFFKGEGIQTLQEKYHQTLQDIPKENEVLFLVDIFGGTPYNAAASFIAKDQRMDMAAGINLPILLEVLSLREHLKLKELLNHLKKMSQQSFQVCSEHLEKAKTVCEEKREDEL